MSQQSGVSYVPLNEPVVVSFGGLALYALNDTSGADPIYVGKVKSDGTWLLQRYTAAGSMTYANVSNNPSYTTYSTSWTDRTGLVYGTFETLTGI